jgi:hypothetical protein
MTFDYTEYELYILNKICYKGRWCKKHIDEKALVTGVPKHNQHLYREGLDSLVRRGMLQRYKSNLRIDYCIPKTNRSEALSILKHYKGQYPFIQNLDCIH